MARESETPPVVNALSAAAAAAAAGADATVGALLRAPGKRTVGESGAGDMGGASKWQARDDEDDDGLPSAEEDDEVADDALVSAEGEALATNHETGHSRVTDVPAVT